MQRYLAFFGVFVCVVMVVYAAVDRRAASADEKVDQSTLAVKTERSFPNLRFERPIVLTHAGDGSNRVFVVSQLGTIHVFANDQEVKQTKTFLDITENVVYKDNENEEGFLGLAFHPKYQKNGQFFAHYTTTDAPHTSVISRFRVSSDDPDKADPSSEEELLRIKQPYWNHNGGNLAFGPDGCLYIGLGDGGSRADPKGNGQNLKTLHGSILRVDVDNKDPGKNYAIPKDNPFAQRDGVRPEIWAYGLRNVWGMSFDRKTGDFWAADVGQDIWEEINIIRRGANYGWNIREAKHKFADQPQGDPARFVDPIWEYHHDIGKSITGGVVYHGKRVPQLEGAYVYADYVSNKIWALRYDTKSAKVISNHSIPDQKKPIISFGEDESGEVYLTDAFGFIYHFTAAK